MTKLTFIGVGSAFTMDNFQSNMLLETTSRGGYMNQHAAYSHYDVDKTIRMLIDCGGDARYALKEIGLTAKDIDGLYVSHCHADHVGGIEWLGFYRYFTPGPKPHLFISERLAAPLWNDSLRGGMSSHQGVLLELDSFFDTVHRIKKNEEFVFGSTRCRPVQVIHYMDGYEVVPSYGLLISPMSVSKEAAEQMLGYKVNPFEAFLTTDTQFAPEQINDFYKRSAIIFQDCETYDWQSDKPRKSGVHAHYSDLKTLPEDVKKKMWLYHYQDGPLPDAKADGFAGFIVKGQSFSFDFKTGWTTEVP